VPGLGTSFGRGGATTAQQDLQYANCILIEGSSMAEAHPVGFRWVMKAKEQGATLIPVDPRFSRTSALADIWVPIRAGTDIAFLGGLIHYAIENGKYFREYVVRYTNAACLLKDGPVQGFFIKGQNPAVGGQHSSFERLALANLKWLVVRDMVEMESACWWYKSPEIERGELKTADIGTGVFFLPAAGHTEKQGTFVNTQRLLQSREKAVPPPGDCRSESWFVHQLAKRLVAKARASNEPGTEALRALDWWYSEDEEGEPDVECVLAEINGWKTNLDDRSVGVYKGGTDREGRLHHGPQLSRYEELKDDGSTASGCWIYNGVIGPDGINKALCREPKGRYGHGWGFTWPADRRII
jgi:anaerobic selenocysteine-containing dehydrogenase